MNAHLTEDQVTACVVEGEATAECRAHVAACADCRKLLAAEMELFSASVGDFSRASLAWSEAQPSISLRGQAAKQKNWAYAPLGWALAAGAVLVTAVPVWQHQHIIPRQVTVSGPADNAEQIAQDNRMLENVNLALAEPDPSPLSAYKLDGRTR